MQELEDEVTDLYTDKREALEQNTHIAGIFWDYASLYQNPPSGRRTATRGSGRRYARQRGY